MQIDIRQFTLEDILDIVPDGVTISKVSGLWIIRFEDWGKNGFNQKQRERFSHFIYRSMLSICNGGYGKYSEQLIIGLDALEKNCKDLKYGVLPQHEILSDWKND